MNFKQIKSLVISFVFLSFGLSGLISPALAHSGHNHNSISPQKHENRQEPRRLDDALEYQSPKQTSGSKKSQSEIPPVIESINNISSVGATSFIQRLSQFGEMIFFLILLFPLGLFSLKRWIQQR